MRRLVVAIAIVAVGAVAGSAQDIPLEYRVKAAYLFNFVRFVEWPAEAPAGPVTICIAGRNPFGDVLADTVRGETVGGRPIVSRVIADPDPGCDVLFIPRGMAPAAWLRGSRAKPTLTVGEHDGFVEQGGMINFVQDGRNVRFQIEGDAASRAGLRISSRLLRLSRATPSAPTQ